MADDIIDLPLTEEPGLPPPARTYAMLTTGLLLVLTVQLVDLAPGVWAGFPLLFGAAFLALQWRDAPPVVLFFILVAVLDNAAGGQGPIGVLRQFVHDGGRHFQRSPLSLSDFLLPVIFVGYSASHYRYLGLVRHLFPPDPRRARGKIPAADPRRLVEEPFRRAPSTVTPEELGVLALNAVAWLVVAVWLWGAVKSSEPAYPTLAPVVWQSVTLLWLFGMGLLLFRAVLGYITQASATPAEHLVFLQEQVWRDTRREQTRNNRWLTWARMRLQRRKERS